MRTCNCPEHSPFHWQDGHIPFINWSPKYALTAARAREALEKRKAKGEDVSVPMAIKPKVLRAR